MKPGILPQQDLQTVDGRPDRRLQQRYLGGSGIHLGVSIGHIQAADKTGFETLMSNFGGFLLGLQILPGNGQLLLKAPEIEIVVADITQQGYQDIPTVFNGGLEVGRGSFNIAAGAPKDIQFPGSIQSYLK